MADNWNDIQPVTNWNDIAPIASQSQNQSTQKPLGAVNQFIANRIPQLAQQQPGILNPNPAQNPLMGQSWLPETKQEPGIIGGIRHWGYENLIRPLASPLGILGSFEGSNPPKEPIGIGDFKVTPKEPPINLGEIKPELTTLPQKKVPKALPARVEPKELPPATTIFGEAAQPETVTKYNIGKQGKYELPSATKIPKITAEPVTNWEDITPVQAQEPAINTEIVKPQDIGFAQRLANWYNGRQASNVVGERVRRQFTNLDTPEGDYSGLLDYQKNPNDPKFANLKGLLSSLREKELQHGLSVNEKRNYLTQLWQETPEQIQAILSKEEGPIPENIQATVNPRLGLNPSFTLPSIISDYAWGIEHGLTPKYSNLSEIAGWRAKASAKSIADMDFWKSLLDNKDISPTKDAYHTTALDPNYLPTRGDKFVWYASPDVATKIKNAIAPNDPGAIVRIGSAIKNAALSVGIPKTGIAPHSFNILSRTITTPQYWPNLIKSMISPSSAIHDIDEAIQSGVLERAVQDGMTFSSEEHIFPKFDRSEVTGNQLATTLEKATQSKYNIFRTPIFETMVPSAKLNIYQTTKAQLMKNGLEEGEAGRTAAHYANELIGGLNVKELGENPNFQKAARFLLFGGDWMRSQYSLTKNMVRSLWNFNDPSGAPYRKTAMGLLGAYITGNAINKRLSGHYMWQNEPTHQFDIETSKTDSQGKHIGFGFMGGGLALSRVIGEAALSVVQGKSQAIPRILESPLSPLVNMGLSLGLNRNFAGSPLYGQDRYGRPIDNMTGLANTGRMLSEHALPSTLPLIYDWLNDKASGAHLATGLTGAPVRYYTPDSEYEARKLLGASLRP